MRKTHTTNFKSHLKSNLQIHFTFLILYYVASTFIQGKELLGFMYMIVIKGRQSLHIHSCGNVAAVRGLVSVKEGPLHLRALRVYCGRKKSTHGKTCVSVMSGKS